MPTTGVTGRVIVDGTPVPANAPLRVTCHLLSASKQTLKSQALTGDDGRFEISTYEQGDGVPAGDYALTFFWGKMNIMTGGYDAPDRLGGRYQEATRSVTKFTVEESGDPIDLGDVVLTSDTTATH